MIAIELLSFLLVFAITMIFSLLALSRFRELEGTLFSAFSMVFWFILSVLQTALSVGTSQMAMSLSYLWLGVGFLFLVLLFAGSLLLFKAHQERKEWEV